MSAFGIILLLFILWFVVRPLFKVWRTYSRLKQGDFSALGDLFGQPGAQKGSSSKNPDGSRKAGWTKPATKKKKIPAGIGEYVNFTEIRTETSETTYSADDGSNTTGFSAEQQITDIDWEDIS